ncbi:MAG TPA: hypothetical protein VN238_01190 [Solirubrobacteraceae bacterium]|nr:hypothetical protein [Solirubrobacteraceae bacterium]
MNLARIVIAVITALGPTLSVVMSLLSGAQAVSGWALSALGVMSAVVALLYVVRNRGRARQRAIRNEPPLRRVAARERRLGRSWLMTSGLLAVAPVLFAPAPLVAVLGSIVSGAILSSVAACGGDAAATAPGDKVVGFSVAIDASTFMTRWRRRAQTAEHVPAARRFGAWRAAAHAPGQVSALLLTGMALTGAFTVSYAAIALSYGVKAATDAYRNAEDEQDETKGDDAADETGGAPEALTYAQLCPALPDPLKIGHGLGVLFKRDGAVEAGCGEPAVLRARGLWTAEGRCQGALRSLGVAVAGRAPVLLYGAPARFALAAARSGRLLAVGRTSHGGGEIVLVVTSSGTTAFVRTSPSRRRSDGPATRCEAVTDVAQAFTRLPPPVTRLWTDEMSRSGWLWPITDGKRWRFVAERTQRVAASASCEGDVCEMVAGGEVHQAAGRSIVVPEELSR